MHDPLAEAVRVAGFSIASNGTVARRTLKDLSRPSAVGGFYDNILKKQDVHEQIAAFHLLLKDDPAIRGFLDCYLLALHYSPERPLRWMVLEYQDTLHYYNLPDLCPVIRSTLIGLCPCPSLQKLFNMFLSGKRYRRLISTVDTSVQLSAAVINTLHGLLLGLYPFNERRLELLARAAIAGRVREAMTTRRHVEMIAAYPNLMCLSLVEYVVNVIEDFCPVEFSMIGLVPGGRSHCLAACEAFRENSVAAAVVSGPFWERLERDAVAVIGSLGKFWRGAHLYQHHPRTAMPGVVEHLSMAISSRVIQNSSSVIGQLKAACPEISFREAEALEEIWTSVYIRRLPAHSTMRQMAVLEKACMCDFRERELYTFPVCLGCCLRKVDVLKGMFRYDCVSHNLVCNECMHAKYLVQVNLLGRVLYVRDRVLLLCEMCLKPCYWDQPCQCHVVDAGAVARCFMCENQNVFSSKQILDVQHMRMRTVSFCFKHTISCVTSEHTVYDLRGLEREMQGRTFRFGG